MKYLICLVLIAIVSSSFLPREDEEMFKFMKFMRQHEREYSSIEEFQERFEIFKSNLRKVDSHEKFSQFMDMTEEEFSARLTLNSAGIAAIKSTMESYKLKNVMGEIPTNFDWREKGAVSAIKNQG